MYWFANYLFPGRARLQQTSLLIIAISFLISFIFILPTGFEIKYSYIPIVEGVQLNPYPYWTYYLLYLLTWIPFKLNYALLIFGVLLGALLIIRSTTLSNPWKLLFSFPLIWVLWYGQLESLVAIGIGLMVYGSNKRDYRWLGLGLYMVSIKPHIAGLIVLLIFLQLKSWRIFIKSLWLIGPAFILSLFQFGLNWPLIWLNSILSTPFFYEHYTNSSLWVWFGPWSLLLWLPVFFIPLDFNSRILLVLSTTLLTMPYAPIYSQLALYLFDMPIWIWIWGLLPWLLFVFGPVIFKFTFIVPALTLIFIYFKWIDQFRKNYDQMNIKNIFFKLKIKDQSQNKTPSGLYHPCVIRND